VLWGDVFRRGVVICVIGLAGCGFSRTPVDNDMGSAPMMDLLGADLIGVDLTSTTNADLLTTVNMSGPGPLGSLPAGFCCNTNEECRSRSCTSLAGGPKFCTDRCFSDDICNVWGGAFRCNTTTDACEPTGVGYSCVPAEQYQYGSKTIGTCCSHGFAKAGQECLGGLCNATGHSANPYYCTQGCNSNTPCPGGYTCAAGFCFITQTVTDLSYMYTCK
jgi:hypothetical protein